MRPIGKSQANRFGIRRRLWLISAQGWRVATTLGTESTFSNLKGSPRFKTFQGFKTFFFIVTQGSRCARTLG